MTEQFIAASVEEAVAAAAQKFGAPESEIEIEVLEKPKKFLGTAFGKYRVRASWNGGEQEGEQSGQEGEQSGQEGLQPEVTEAAEPVQTGETAEEPAAEQTAEPSAETAPAVPESGVSTAVKNEKARAAQAYLEKILAILAPDARCECEVGESVEISVSGANAGVLIGRRGETLDALQYLTSIAANRADGDYVRVTLDIAGYRDRRRKALEELGTRVGTKVLRTGRNCALEPMNPFERSIIHSAVAKIDGVSSHSVGEEPYRRVIITSDSADSSAPVEEYGAPRRGRDRDRGSSNRPERRRRPSGEGPRKLDLSTSFEKDYKRPKPEDSLNAGVYGKIDL